jgi:ribosomal protein S18 acetylase RimI-like enzyme
MHYLCRRAVSADEVRSCHIEWGANEQWNTSMNDADSLFAQDPNGFFIGELTDENGTRPIASLQVARYDCDYAHIAAYQVLRDYRGKGYGKQLWDYAMEYAYADGRTLGLDGAVAQQNNYKKIGFVEAFYSYRYRTDASNIRKIAENNKYTSGFELKSAMNVSFDDVLAYDTKYVGAPRSKFIKSLLTRNDAKSLVALNGKKIIGLAVIRKSMEGWRFGPLYAESSQIARELFVSLSDKVQGTVFIETPKVKRGENIMEIHEEFEMKECGENSRMYIKGQSEKDFAKLPTANIYGIIWELG